MRKRNVSEMSESVKAPSCKQVVHLLNCQRDKLTKCLEQSLAPQENASCNIAVLIHETSFCNPTVLWITIKVDE